MPVTARLSRKFYDRLGDDIANELVDWFNSVDATYRFDLKELNELNFARFDAKVEQRFAESDAKLERRFAQFESMWERRFAALEMNRQRELGELSTNWQRQLAELETNWDRRFAGLRTELDTLRSEFAGLRIAFAKREVRLVRWMFAFWSANLLAMAGLLFAMTRIR